MTKRGVFQFDGRAIPFVVHDREWIEIDGKSHRFFVHRQPHEVTVWLDGRTYRLPRTQKGAQALGHAFAAGSGEVRSLMPGKVLRIDVRVGDTVAEKQTVVVMESMKMESPLMAPRAGSVTAVQCAVGKIVEMGELLIVID